ncbi:MAG: type I secretion protein, partial [Alphaproteobacteria bacterium]|nr:type I secretion protein [Alphaproteobacteria bacterium]
MPTSYTDQFLTIDPYSPPPAGTSMTYSVRTLTDQNDDSDFDRFDNDNINGIDITASYAGDTVTLNVP